MGWLPSAHTESPSVSDQGCPSSSLGHPPGPRRGDRGPLTHLRTPPDTTLQTSSLQTHPPTPPFRSQRIKIWLVTLLSTRNKGTRVVFSFTKRTRHPLLLSHPKIQSRDRHYFTLNNGFLKGKSVLQTKGWSFSPNRETTPRVSKRVGTLATHFGQSWYSGIPLTIMERGHTPLSPVGNRTYRFPVRGGKEDRGKKGLGRENLLSQTRGFKMTQEKVRR